MSDLALFGTDLFGDPIEQPSRGPVSIEVVISEKMARLPFQGCDLEYIRTMCHGRCCWTTDKNGRHYTTIYAEPEQRPAIEAEGGVFDCSGVLKTCENGHCTFQGASGLCGLHVKGAKPRSCFISPWILSPKNRLIIRNRYRLLRCFKAAPRVPAYRAFRSGLAELFGPDEMAFIVEHFDQGGGDYKAQMPGDRAALVRDVMHKWHAGATATPIEQAGDAWAKRDDLAEGGLGAKARAIGALIAANTKGRFIVTGGQRHSVQVVVAARVAQRHGLLCRVHVPMGADTEETEEAIRQGAVVIRHKAGYSTVIRARVREDAATIGETAIHVPPGLDFEEAVVLVAKQAEMLKAGRFSRVVVCGGSGITAAGILRGCSLPVLVVEVGSSTRKMLEKYAPAGWADRTTIQEPIANYNNPAPVTTWRGIDVDPYYEAKAATYVRAGDLFWLTAHRRPR